MDRPAFNLSQAQTSRLTMTFALRQALSILQMPQLELAEWLDREITKNPLLEEISSPRKSLIQEEIATPISLHDHLLRQIRENFSIDVHREIAEEFLKHLDEKGFLAISLEEMAILHRKSLFFLEHILEVLQTFDPPGIFARNLSETLVIQLKTKGIGTGPSMSIVKNCFDDLIHGRYASIRQKIGPSDLAQALKPLANLRFRPAESYKTEPAPLAIADLQMVPNDLKVCEERLPKFQIHTKYQSLILQSPEEKQLFRSWTTQAHWLCRSLKRRRQILLKIGEYLIQKQAPYLSQTGPLRPLSLQTLATHLQLHESTLSRALSGKYASTPCGLIPLRSLVAASPATSSLKKALHELVTQENKEQPFTDHLLSSQLKTMGYTISRRTITKYRKALKIGPASSRKALAK